MSLHRGDGLATLTFGIQTTGKAQKEGQIFNLYKLMRVSFEDIGGLSQYIGALKEMVPTTLS